MTPGHVTSPITLTTGELVIDKNLTIQGPTTASLTISGNNNSRVFNIQTGNSLVMSYLTITGGKITGDNGGGIFSLGDLTILNSTFTGNQAAGGEGGAIDSEGGTLRIINSTISGNSADLSGGGLLNCGSSTGFLTNVTITDNRSDADGDGTGEGGGIAQVSSSDLTINNIIVAGNFKGMSSTANDFFVDVAFGSFIDPGSSHNLIGVDTGLSSDIMNGSGGNQIGTAVMPIDPRLGALGNNGGPTNTHLLLPNSTARDAGSNVLAIDPDPNNQDNNALPNDQRGRGFPRIVNTTVDIGAVEVNYAISATAGTPQSTPINTAFGTQLQATVSESGNPISGLMVTFTAPGSGASGTFPGNVTTATAATNASGVATAPTFTANGMAGGPYNVVASLGAGLPTANFALTNLKGNQTITFGAIANKTFGDPDFIVSASASSGLPVSFSASGQCTVTGPSPGTVHITGAGSCTITASQAGDANYNPAPNVPQTFSIAKANQTITFGAIANKTFGDPDFLVNPTASSGLPVSLSAVGKCTVTSPAPGTVHLTGAGACTITASQAGNANFNAATNVPQSFSIGKADQTIFFDPLTNKTFGDADFFVNPAVSSDLSVNLVASGNCTVTSPAPGTVHLTGAGSCTITASQPGDANHNPAVSVSRSFSIAKANQTIAFGALANKTFGDADFNVSATASSGLSVSFAATGNCTIAGNTVHLTGAGACTITASQAGNANFNAAANVPQSFNIAKANQTITFGALANKTFGDADFNVSATASSGLSVSFTATGNCTIAANTVHLTGAGSCTITAAQAGNANFNNQFLPTGDKTVCKR